MNPNVTLEELANGVSSCERVMPLDPSVLQALQAAVTTQRTITPISTSVNARTIDNTSLGGGVENQVEFTFTNNTAVTITYWFSALFFEAGDCSAFYVPGNCASDYPAAYGSGANQEGGGSDLYRFNKMALSNPGGFIIGSVEVTTSNTSAQQNQNLRINSQNISQDQCNSRRLAPICDSCNNNGNSTTFTARFRCPLAVGGNMSFGYDVLPGETVTLRVNVIGVGVGQYKSVASDCGC